ncbi:hypothetical protein [Haloferax sp. DFSO52]|uniref:hypothetical protein n=1 Tax=Haloferax sp. DFSO52 TaxID=3388505 RepID=UPI003A86DA41
MTKRNIIVMPVASYAPIFHELGGNTGTQDGPYVDAWGWPYHVKHYQWVDVQFRGSHPHGFVSYGAVDQGQYNNYSGSTLGLLPITLPDGAKPNSLTVIGYCTGSVRFELFSQSLTYLSSGWDGGFSPSEGTAELARIRAGWAEFHSTEDRRFERSGPNFTRTVRIRTVDSGVIDNSANWYGLYAEATSGRCYLTGVKITYDEDDSKPLPPVLESEREVDRIPDEWRTPIELELDTVLDVSAARYSFIGIAQDGELLEFEQATDGPSTFILPPGAYEVWTDGDSTEVTEWPLLPDSRLQPSRRDTEPRGKGPTSE